MKGKLKMETIVGLLLMAGGVFLIREGGKLLDWNRKPAPPPAPFANAKTEWWDPPTAGVKIIRAKQTGAIVSVIVAGGIPIENKVYDDSTGGIIP